MWGEGVLQKVTTKGTLLKCKLKCDHHESEWTSQRPKVDQEGPLFNGNIDLEAGILLSGISLSGFQRAMSITNVQVMSEQCFYQIQKKYLFPAVNSVYEKRRNEIVERVKSVKELNLVGDGRFDSPGHSAKYGTYTFMNEDSKEIIDFFIAHKSNAGSSTKMELYSFIKVLNSLLEAGFDINTITTDRHKSIRKYLREKHPEIAHQFDVWHFSKKIKKMLAAKGKLKRNKDLLLWTKSIINHLWWSSATCETNPILLKEKWLSIINHVANVHKWKSNKLYHACNHRTLTKKDERSKKWLPKRSHAYKALKDIVTDKNVLKDLPHLSLFRHSGELEVFHSLYNMYCPKRIGYSYAGMYARTQLAVMDHNCGIARQQAKTKAGKLRYNTVFSKVTASWVAKRIMEEKNKTFITEILEKLRSPDNLKGVTVNLENIPKNIATEPNPGKEKLIAEHRSRFMKQKQ